MRNRHACQTYYDHRPEPDREFPIQDEVLRLGSGAQCEYRLGAGAAHSATLEYRNGSYHLHNRGDDPITINGRRLELRESVHWPEGDEVDFGRGVTLRLDIQGDPAPAKASATYTIEYDAEEEVVDPDAAKKAEVAKKAASSKTTMQLVVIGVCVVLGAFMLMMDEPATEKEDMLDPRVEFAAIIDKLMTSEKGKDPGPFSLRSTLQSARVAELRGDEKEARKSYGAVITMLKNRQADGKFTDDDKVIWNFVNSRVSALKRPILP